MYFSTFTYNGSKRYKMKESLSNLTRDSNSEIQSTLHKLNEVDTRKLLPGLELK